MVAQITTFAFHGVDARPVTVQVQLTNGAGNIFSIVGLPEEECGGEILDATVMLIRAGLFTISTVEPGTGAFWFGGDTKMTPTRLLTGYVYGEPGEPLDEEEDDWS